MSLTIRKCTVAVTAEERDVALREALHELRNALGHEPHSCHVRVAERRGGHGNDTVIGYIATVDYDEEDESLYNYRLGGV